ncbi:hypothetical protein GGX14DRAFT_528865 [Mycena pura]|uniref:Uncharacterized protein n=1 Tax=Mycena pura TaxID=153505 RepID=A0AAD6USN2_9AGAR|nr:hypothetical protein GGX14DRAFT_528865 [Mycena pura]
MATQSKIPSALIALHNVILEHDETDLERWLGNPDALDNLMGLRRDDEIDFGRLATSLSTSAAEKRHAESTRDRIAQGMWHSYEQYLAEQMDIDNYEGIQPADLD